MTYQELFKILLNKKIVLADIKDIFEGYLHVDFNRYEIIKNDIILNADLTKLFDLLDQHYPVPYLIGYIDILSLHLFLNESTLIPRMETADFIKSYLKDNFDFNNKVVLDLCTGSGIIALAIKKYFYNAKVYASDISLEVLNVAKKNSEYNNLDVTFIQSDYLNDINLKFDYIISNPPYIEENSIDVDAPFEPSLALYSGKDGLDSYRKILNNLDNHLNDNGYAFFEIESTNCQNTLNLFNDMLPKKYHIKLLKDIYDRERFIQVKKN